MRSGCFIATTLGNLYLLSKIRNFLSFNVALWIRTNRKWMPVDGPGVNVWENPFRIMLRFSFENITAFFFFFFFLLWTFVLCPTARLTVESTLLDACVIRPGEAEEAPRVCYLNTGRSVWKGRKSDSAEATGSVSQFVCVWQIVPEKTKTKKKTPGWL